jgi:hypothetical protein
MTPRPEIVLPFGRATEPGEQSTTHAELTAHDRRHKSWCRGGLKYRYSAIPHRRFFGLWQPAERMICECGKCHATIELTRRGGIVSVWTKDPDSPFI